VTAQSRSQIAAMLDQHGVTPSHKLGQNFLADANITRKIVALSGVGPGDRVVEVGAGTGSLSRALASAGARVVAYEVDDRLRPILTEVTRGLPIEVRWEDATAIDLDEALADGPWTMVANLPYNVGTPLVLDALRHSPRIERFVVMVQREVAERLVAGPGSRVYGLPSVIVALHGQARLAMRVPPQVFIPQPNVESAVVIVERTTPPPGAGRALEIAAAGFGQRRKMLRKSLAGVLADPVAAIEAVGLDPEARAEDLSASDFARLATL
jgi:16S rRNA (adenine1518-N6/adenine1519-N6)-dimethyltransferase